MIGLSRSRRLALLALLAGALFLSMASQPTRAATAGRLGSKPLVLVDHAQSSALVVVSENAGKREKQAAEDLAKYIELMTDVPDPVTHTAESVEASFSSGRPLLIVGQAALSAKPELKDRLARVVKQKPFLRADGIVLLRENDRVYLAGNNDESHYFAVAELLRAWGVRWFIPGAFGEFAPEEKQLSVGDLDIAYAPPFEARLIWVAWRGDATGLEDFLARNMMIPQRGVPSAGHALGKYTKGLGKDALHIPLSDPATADQVAREVDGLYAAGKDFSLAMEDGVYVSTSPTDDDPAALQWDKYALQFSVSNPMLGLLNGVAKRLREKYPDSKSKIGFLAYSNMYLPPTREITLEPSLFGMLAPIDIDPNHSVDDPRSETRREYGGILKNGPKSPTVACLSAITINLCWCGAICPTRAIRSLNGT